MFGMNDNSKVWELIAVEKGFLPKGRFWLPKALWSFRRELDQLYTAQEFVFIGLSNGNYIFRNHDMTLGYFVDLL